MQDWLDTAFSFALPLGVGLGIRAAVRYHNERYRRGTIFSAGRRRRYLVHVPERYDPASPTLPCSSTIRLHWRGAGGGPRSTQRRNLNEA